MSKTLRNYLFGKHRRNPMARAIARRAEKISLAYRNFNYDARSNGEEWFLQNVIAPKSPSVIFDVGANDGSWALNAARLCPRADVHAFEIVPQTADVAARNVDGEKRIILNRCGLSDKPGTIAVRTFAGQSTHASILDLPHGTANIVDCPVMRGDDYVAEKNIGRIDLLKIDVEGAENRVIAGLYDTLSSGKIGAIQFEYGRANILSKFLLKDWYDLLTPLDYRIGKLYPDYIDFKSYDLHDEDFIGPNYVAVKGA